MMAPAEHMIEAEQLTRTFVSRGGERVDAIRELTVSIARGKFVHLTGPSGSGKTTFLTLVGCMLAPTSGRLTVARSELGSIEPSARAAFRLRHIGFVFQRFRLVRWLTAEENIRLPLELVGSKVEDERTLELLDLVGMSHRRSFYPHELSGGEQQRIAVARALAADPEIILADEPTGNLDSKMGSEVLQLLRAAATQRAKTVIVASHADVVRSFADEILTLNDGLMV